MKRIINLCTKARVMRDTYGSPAIETAAIITFIGLLVITKAGGVAGAIGGAFDAVINGITTGLKG